MGFLQKIRQHIIYGEVTMKKSFGVLSMLMLVAMGCSSPDAKLAGRWQSPALKGFEAEFNADHTGATYSPMQGHAGTTTQTTKLPFSWSISKDGTIKITENKNTYTGKLSGKKLELVVNDAKTVLVKVK
jgi:hypothetical protein